MMLSVMMYHGSRFRRRRFVAAHNRRGPLGQADAVGLAHHGVTRHAQRFADLRNRLPGFPELLEHLNLFVSPHHI